MGRVLRDACRLADEPARYGGEELAVVLAGVELEAARRLAERLRAEVGALELTAPDGGPLRVTASIGVAALDATVSTGNALIAAADGALYAAKAAGKDRVCAAPDPLAAVAS